MIAAAMADDTAIIEKILHQANIKFTSKMLSEVVKESPGKSVVMSPFSVLIPLAQLALASEGPSHDEIFNVISMTSNDEIEKVFKWNKKLKSLQDVQLNLASRFYIDKDYKLNENFQELSRNVFDSDIKNVDFSNRENAAKEINLWVEDQTNHVIKNLIKPGSISSRSYVVLVNAIYFKGRWMSPFQIVQERNFHVSKENTVKVKAMEQQNPYSYTESSELNSKLLRLPYVGNVTSMLVILPNEIDGLAALLEKLKDPEAISRATKTMNMEDRVSLSLPKFRIETTIDLKEVLKNIGVKKLFTSEANLINLLKGQNNVPVSSAIQKAYIDVNELGTEAAAANAFIISGFSGGEDDSPVKKFIVDRPFYLQLDISMDGNKYISIFNAVVTLV